MLPRVTSYFIQNKVRSVLAIIFLVFITWYIFSLPDPLFTDPNSTTLEDKDNRLLSAAIAQDGQWRFPAETELPDKFKEAIVTFEDKRFWGHPGVDVRALVRAIRQNIVAGKVVSGGSTLSMQVVRLSQKRKGRNLWSKLKEIILATRLELTFSKNEILNSYAAHAPFGGNTVGLSAACARYFGNRAA